MKTNIPDFPKTCKTCINYDAQDDVYGRCTLNPEWSQVGLLHFCSHHEYNLLIQEKITTSKKKQFWGCI